MVRGAGANTRCTIALFSGSPGTMGTAPLAVGFSASSRISSRMPAMRVFLSGPWQRKQVSAMMGRMSRLKRTSAGAAAATSTIIRANLFIARSIHPAPKLWAAYTGCGPSFQRVQPAESRLRPGLAAPHPIMGCMVLVGWILSVLLVSVQLYAQPSAKVDFTRDVQPLLQKRCHLCHGPQQQMSGLRLDQKEAALRVIQPRNSAASR